MPHTFRNAVRVARSLQRSQPQLTRSQGIAAVVVSLATQDSIAAGPGVVGDTLNGVTIALTGGGWRAVFIGFWNALAGKAYAVRLSPGVLDEEAKTQQARIVEDYASAGPFTVALNVRLNAACVAVAVQAKRIIIPIFARSDSVEAAAAWDQARSNT